MDFLLEMTPGSGWLARENNRVVFLPHSETVDIAHDVIEPLLVPRETDAAFATLESWIESSRPLPPVILIGLESSVVVLNNGVAPIMIGQAGRLSPIQVDLGKQIVATELAEATSVSVMPTTNDASGMLIEGVIRAGGFTVHVHSNASARTSHEVARNPTPAVRQLHLDEYSVEIGDGMVVGRWPYKHPEYNDELEPLILADPAVSRLHAEVVPQNDGVAVIDKQSHNGTWVVSAETKERVRLTPEVPYLLGDGDQILLGDTVIRFGGAE